MFKKILAATDTPQYCDNTVRVAAQIAKFNDAELHILHVPESSSPIYRNFVHHYHTGDEIVADENYLKEVKQVMADSCDRVFKPEIKPAVNAVNGFPWEEIVRLSRKIDPDLIVLGPHTPKRPEDEVKRTYGHIGTTLEGVIRRGRCPLMIVNRPVRRKNLEMKKIMIASDFSLSCKFAFQFAEKVCAHYRSKMYAFHMLPV